MTPSTPPNGSDLPPDGAPPARCPRCGDPLASPLDACPCDAAFAAPAPKPKRRAPLDEGEKEGPSAVDAFADKFSLSGGVLALFLAASAWWGVRIPVFIVYLVVAGGINLQGDYGPPTPRAVVALNLAVALWAWFIYLAAALGVTLRIPDPDYRRAAWAHFPATLCAVGAGFLAGAGAVAFGLNFSEGARAILTTEGPAFEIAVLAMPVGGLAARVAFFRWKRM